MSSETAERLKLIKLKINSIETKHEKFFSSIRKLKDYELKLFIDNTVPPVAQKVRPLPVPVSSISSITKKRRKRGKDMHRHETSK